MNLGWAVTASPASAEPESLIENLPNELLQLVFGLLPAENLKQVALVSKCFHRHATDYLWQHVNLMDKWHLHVNPQTKNIFGGRGSGESDEHDDTPIIQKLYILATNPVLASKVQVLTHRCHLPTPNIFAELPHMYFDGENLSQDDRIQTLLWLAIRNLVNVHTLRIIYGHYNLTRILLAAFLDPGRSQRIQLRKLWLESCCISGFGSNYTNFLSPLYSTGLESVRIRRLRFESDESPRRTKVVQHLEYKLSRGGRHFAMHNAAGGFVYTTIDISTPPTRPLPAGITLPTPAELRAKADVFDTAIWDKLPEILPFVDSNQFPYPNLKPGPPNPAMTIIEKSRSTLTSLNLDWVLWRQQGSNDDTPVVRHLQQLSRLRFPQLRAFQLRNAVVSETGLPEGVYLFEDMFLDFMEAHTKIQCLAWPLDRFYSHSNPSASTVSRTRGVVAHLGNVLLDLRLDCFYSGNGEMVTDQGREPQEREERIRRRRFIGEFAPYLRKIEQLKLEGGIPRDEKRELLRAMHYSPLKKLVLIGVTFPIGNTWGARGIDLKTHDSNHVSDATYQLEAEDFDGILASYKNPATTIPSNFTFEPYYGWRAEAPFLQTIALHHASTVQELKLCGYNGSPILSYLTPITTPLLYPLRHFDNLRQLVISFWLLTTFEDQYRDTEIIQSWMDTRSPSSTALVVVTPPATPPIHPPVDPGMMPRFTNPPPRHQDFNRWAVQLKTRFTPSALAYRVRDDIAPHLSEVAKSRPGGVRVRASFCLGSREEARSANDIFDLDLRIGRGGQMLEFVGPREEAERGRFWQKLEGRRWF